MFGDNTSSRLIKYANSEHRQSFTNHIAEHDTAIRKQHAIIPAILIIILYRASFPQIEGTRIPAIISLNGYFIHLQINIVSITINKLNY